MEHSATTCSPGRLLGYSTFYTRFSVPEHVIGWMRFGIAYADYVILLKFHVQMYMYSVFNRVPYSLDQTLLSISRCSQIEAAAPDVRKEIVAALE